MYFEKSEYYKVFEGIGFDPWNCVKYARTPVFSDKYIPV